MKRMRMTVAILALVGLADGASAQVITAVERHNSNNAPPAIAQDPLGEMSLCFVDRTHV